MLPSGDLYYGECADERSFEVPHRKAVALTTMNSEGRESIGTNPHSTQPQLRTKGEVRPALNGSLLKGLVQGIEGLSEPRLLSKPAHRFLTLRLPIRVT